MVELDCVEDGASFEVFMTKKVARVFEKADPKSRSRCRKWIKFYAEDGPKNLIDTQFKPEGRFNVGDAKGTKIQIYAFKAYQLRVYGGLIPGTNKFVCTEIDRTKKQDAADQNRLKRAASNLGKVISDWGD